MDAHFLGFVDFFNRQKFYEAHEILEVLWLPARKHPDGEFYKGLIQLAGAFVHLQKDRLRPAAALFKLAQENLGRYPAAHRKLDVAAVSRAIVDWLNDIEINNFTNNPFGRRHCLVLKLA
jgi:predicted metal-dependent hydrolase